MDPTTFPLIHLHNPSSMLMLLLCACLSLAKCLLHSFTPSSRLAHDDLVNAEDSESGINSESEGTLLRSKKVNKVVRSLHHTVSGARDVDTSSSAAIGVSR